MGFFKKAGAAKTVKRKGKLLEKRDAKKSKKVVEDEEISSDEEESVVGESVPQVAHDDEGSGDDYNDTNDKTAREAQMLLQAIKQVEGERDESEDEAPKEPVRAKKERRIIADKIQLVADAARVIHRRHQLSPVCVALSSEGNVIVSCSKDGSIVKYDIKSAKCEVLRRKKAEKSTDICHVGQVTSCAVSPDDKYVVSGGIDTLIKVWDLKTLGHVKDFKSHQGPVTSLAFRQGCDSLELFSASADRSVKAWNLSQMGFVDTMYGHQHVIPQIDMLDRPRVLTCGGHDKTLRLFKVAESSQLVFNAYAECMGVDTVAMLDAEHFVSGAMDGSINVWSISKKKPVCMVTEAHGRRADSDEPNWICSVAACPYTDLIATGSCDGTLKLWKVSVHYKSLTLRDSFEVKGFINDIRFAKNAEFIVCAVGQEHKSGRWWRIKEARNSIVTVPLKTK